VFIAPIFIPSVLDSTLRSSLIRSRSIKTLGSINLFLSSTSSDCPPAIGSASFWYCSRWPNASAKVSGRTNFLSIITTPCKRLRICLDGAFDFVSELLNDCFSFLLNERVTEGAQPTKDIDVSFKIHLSVIALGTEGQRHRLAHATRLE